MLTGYYYLGIILLLETYSNTKIEYPVIKGGGYSARFCLDSTDNFVEMKYSVGSRKIDCTKDLHNCTTGSFYICNLNCNFDEKILYLGEVSQSFKLGEKPKFTLSNHTSMNKGPGNNITIYSDLAILPFINPKSIKLKFSADITCRTTNQTESSLLCYLDLSRLHFTGRKDVNVNISYGKSCIPDQVLGAITIFAPKHETSLYWIAAGLVAIIFLMTILAWIFVVKNNKAKRLALIDHKKELEEMGCKYSEAQKTAFLEYQNAVQSFSNLGRLTPRHLLPFRDYMSRIFNVELNVKSEESDDGTVEAFRSILLNQTTLIEWIDKMEKNCRGQDRSLIASLLTIVLFQHPNYLLNIMRILLKKSLIQLKNNFEEQLLFRKSDAIVEKLVGNWITLCMYRNMKTGEIGKRFFNLYRAIKCKMETGLVDAVTKKAKYALTFDHIMLGELNYEVLKIKASVQVQLKMVDSTQKPLQLCMENIDVEVLSLDTISQVKGKILDKATMVYADMENLNLIDDAINISISPTDHNELRLHFVSNTTKLLLEDFDTTSIRSNIDENCVMINTMKHFNMTTGMRFLLTSITMEEPSCRIDRLYSMQRIQIHLQIPNDLKLSTSEKRINLKKEMGSKLPIHPTIEDMNKENYLMRLLAIKKSLLPFIDGFFQCLTNWKPGDATKTSSNSLFEPIFESQIADNLLNASFKDNSEDMNSQLLVSRELYLMPTYYLFSMLDEIAVSLSIVNQMAVKLWKSNSFILRFWVNLIKNPNFIFSVERLEPIDDSLTTVAAALMESCSDGSSNVDINSPIIKQLFLEDVKDKYSHWWRTFVSSAHKVNEADVITIMTDIAESNKMSNYYNSSLRSLETITHKFLSE